MSRIITDSKMKLRDRLSFFIFVSLVIVSLCISCLITVANPDTVVNAFCDKEVVEDLRSDVSLYAKDMCLENNLPDDFVDNSITYDSMYYLQKSYISGRLGASAEFNENAFESHLEEFKDDLTEDVNKMIADRNVQVDGNVSDTAVMDFCSDIADYIDSRVNLSYINSVVTGVKTLRTLSVVLLVIFALTGTASTVFMVFKGGKTYRIVRHISYSVLGASLVGFINACVVAVVKATKDLVIYPLYIAKAFMIYVDSSIHTIIVSSLCLLVIFFVLVTSVWRIKRDEND